MFRPRFKTWLAVFFGLAPILSAPARAADDETAYVRLKRDAQDRPVLMETAIVRFVSKETDPSKRKVVELVGAIHIADAQYYERLNREFEQYDALLYELVAPEGRAVPPKGVKAQSTSAISTVQLTMKRFLELEFQLEKIDYTKGNFVHADMSPEQFSQSMKERGESFVTMFFKLMMAEMSRQSKGKSGPSDIDILFALFDKNRSLALKRLMAGQLENMEDQLSAFTGPKGSTILTARNDVCLKVLRKSLDSGQKKIGIFYGAAHLKDMEKKLLADFGLQRESTRWLPAWDMSEASIKKTDTSRSR